jgi:hypothetical protein
LQTFVSAGAALPKDDADYLIPRRRHCGLENPTAEAAREALAYFDSRHRLTGSAYDEPYWSLGDALKWITERTREAVDGASVDEEAATKAVVELLDALAHGEVHATGSTARNPVPRPFLPATWVSHHIWLEDDGNLLWPFVAHIAKEREELLYIRLPREELIRRWPPLNVPEAVPPSTQGKETACKGWLSAMMRADPDRGCPKDAVWAQASTKFPGLAKRAFDRAWTAAIKDSGAGAWQTPGRRPKIKSPH